MMMNAFYKQKPIIDTPCRQLIAHINNGGWEVRLRGGTKWGAEHTEEMKILPVKSFEEASEVYDKEYKQLEAEGWKPYSPQQTW